MAEEYSDETNRNPSILVEPPEDVTIPHIVTGRPPLNIEWCWIPAGPFTMGSESDDAHGSEKPVHTVDLEGFWLARYPLTNAKYRLFIEAGGYDRASWWSKAGWQWRQRERIQQPRYWTDDEWSGDKQPVVAISWYEADAFTRWAAEATGEPIRLPTEVEWEKAARSTDGRTYPWGNYPPTKVLCNFDYNEYDTTLVGQYSPAGDGPYGNADMAGNVWEWTSSQYKAYPYDAGDGREDQVAQGTRMIRGGSYADSQWFVRTSCRNFDLDPASWGYYVGFRLATSVTSGS